LTDFKMAMSRLLSPGGTSRYASEDSVYNISEVQKRMVDTPCDAFGLPVDQCSVRTRDLQVHISLYAEQRAFALPCLNIWTC